jgi:hypothetical protein
MPRNLFGQPIKTLAPDSIEAGLIRRDKATREGRAARWQFLENFREDGHYVQYMGPHEGGLLFRESELTYVDGHFTASILLIHAIVESMLTGWFIACGHGDIARRGLGRMLKFVRQHNLLEPYIVEQIDRLRRKRNHLTHLTLEDELRIDFRMRRENKWDEQELMREDAESALGLLHHLYGTKFRRIKITN